jgi:hypothetical protein
MNLSGGILIVQLSGILPSRRKTISFLPHPIGLSEYGAESSCSFTAVKHRNLDETNSQTLFLTDTNCISHHGSGVICMYLTLGSAILEIICLSAVFPRLFNFLSFI